MAIDTAELRRAAANPGFHLFGPSGPPDGAKNAEWRKKAACTYGRPVAELLEVLVTLIAKVDVGGGSSSQQQDVLFSFSQQKGRKLKSTVPRIRRRSRNVAPTKGFPDKTRSTRSEGRK